MDPRRRQHDVGGVSKWGRPPVPLAQRLTLAPELLLFLVTVSGEPSDLVYSGLSLLFVCLCRPAPVVFRPPVCLFLIYQCLTHNLWTDTADTISSSCNGCLSVVDH